MQRNWITRVSLAMAATACAVPSFGQNRGIPVEFTFWGGTTTIDGRGAREVESGIRMAEIAVMPTSGSRAWLRYDNSLSLDNFELVRTGEETPAYYLGFQTALGSGTQGLIEVGHRQLPGDVDQTIIRGEYVMFMPMNTSLKLGAWAGPRDDDHTEWMAYVGYGFPVGGNIRIEPTFFYSRSGFGNEDQYRIYIPAEYPLPQGFKIIAGIGFGKSSTPTGNGRYTGGHIQLEGPIGQNVKAYFLVRRESIEGDLNIFNIALGLTVGLR